MLKPEKYTKTVNRAYAPLYASLLHFGRSSKECELKYLPRPALINHTVISDNDWYYSTSDLNNASKILLTDLRIPENLQRAITALQEQEAVLEQSVTKDVLNFLHEWTVYSPAIIIAWVPEERIEKTVQEALLGRTSNNEAEHLMNLITIPLRDNYYRIIDKDLLSTDSLADHVQKYSWCLSRFATDTPYTIKDAQERLQHLDKDNYISDLDKQRQQVEQAIMRAKELLDEQSSLVDLVQFMVFYRTHRTDVLNKMAFLAIPLLSDFARQHNLTYTELINCTYSEIQESRFPSTGILHSRMHNYAMISDFGHTQCYTGKESENIRRLFNIQIIDLGHISGRSAYKGTISGRVTLIMNENDFNKVRIGDILVCPTTSPNMIQIMQKAAAFVTDEGGITCHAAIISREMKKPCIIGTKNATKVLKDGDLVEVDANFGVVNVIQRK